MIGEGIVAQLVIKARVPRAYLTLDTAVVPAPADTDVSLASAIVGVTRDRLTGAVVDEQTGAPEGFRQFRILPVGGDVSQALSLVLTENPRPIRERAGRFVVGRIEQFHHLDSFRPVLGLGDEGSVRWVGWGEPESVEKGLGRSLPEDPLRPVGKVDGPPTVALERQQILGAATRGRCAIDGWRAGCGIGGERARGRRLDEKEDGVSQ